MAIGPKQLARPRKLLMQAAVSAGVSIVGFTVLVLVRSHLEYGAIGYVVLFGPMYASVVTVVLFVFYLRAVLAARASRPTISDRAK